jgi:hypothetical protein
VVVVVKMDVTAKKLSVTAGEMICKGFNFTTENVRDTR